MAATTKASVPPLLCRERIVSGEAVLRALPEQYLIHVGTPAIARQGLRRSRMRTFQMIAGTIILPLRNVEEWVQLEKGTQLLTMRIRDEAIQSAALDTLPAGHAGLQPEMQFEDARLSGLLTAIDAEQTVGCPAGRIFMDALEHAVAILLLRRRIPQIGGRSCSGLAPFRRRRVTEFIEANLNKPPGLAELAGIAGLSQSHFISMFRNSTGFTPHQYVLRRRIAHAKRLLRDPEQHLIHVADACGFTTPQHLSRIFRILTGITPGEYRRNL